MKTFYKVTLEAMGNPDHDENPYQYIVNPIEITGDTIDEIVTKTRKWQEENSIGGGNWKVPEVWTCDEMGYMERVGYMSYNGRIWAERR